MTRFTLIVTAILLCQWAVASDIADEVRKSNAGSGHISYGYLEVAMGFSCYQAQSALIRAQSDFEATGCRNRAEAGGELRFMGVFAEVSTSSQDGANFGYTFWSNENWRVDFLAASVDGSYEAGTGTLKDPERPGLSELERDIAILNRDTVYVGMGTRITYFFGENILQYRLVSDIHNNNGITSTMRLGRSWQVKNWHLHGVASLIYTSEKTNNYLYGISEQAATQRFAAYSPEHSLEAGFEAGVAYPISRRWVFRSDIRYSPLAQTKRDSPLTDKNWTGSFNTRFVFVF